MASPEALTAELVHPCACRAPELVLAPALMVVQTAQTAEQVRPQAFALRLGRPGPLSAKLAGSPAYNPSQLLLTGIAKAVE
jgi:hypothetical protein